MIVMKKKDVSRSNQIVHYYNGVGPDKTIVAVRVLPQCQREDCRDSAEGHTYRLRLLSEVANTSYTHVCSKCGAAAKENEANVSREVALGIKPPEPVKGSKVAAGKPLARRTAGASR